MTHKANYNLNLVVEERHVLAGGIFLAILHAVCLCYIKL